MRAQHQLWAKRGQGWFGGVTRDVVWGGRPDMTCDCGGPRPDPMVLGEPWKVRRSKSRLWFLFRVMRGWKRYWPSALVTELHTAQRTPFLIDSGMRPKDPHAGKGVWTGGREEGIVDWRRAGATLEMGSSAQKPLVSTYTLHTHSQRTGDLTGGTQVGCVCEVFVQNQWV